MNYSARICIIKLHRKHKIINICKIGDKTVMKYAITSLNTKKEFADALKTCMQTKPLTKITVSELIRICGVNRKTFYYHFENVYDLLKWTLDQEAINLIKEFDIINNFEDAITFIVKYVHENQQILSSAFDSMSREELKRFFYPDFLEITRIYIKNSAKLKDLTISEDFLNFITHFYTEAIIGLLIDEFKTNTQHDVNKIIKNMSVIINYSLPNILLHDPK